MGSVAAETLFLETQTRFINLWRHVGAYDYVIPRFDSPPPDTIPPYFKGTIAMGEFMHHSCGYVNKMKITGEVRMPEGWANRELFELCIMRMLKEGRQVTRATDFRGAPTTGISIDPTGSFKAAGIEIMPLAFEMWMSVDY